MALTKWQRTYLYNDTSGVVHGPLTGVSTTVNLAGTSTLATLFSDLAGLVPLANPFTNDPVFGLATFYAQAGLYDVIPTKPTFTLPIILNELLGGTDNLSVSLTQGTASGQPIITLANLIPANARVVGVFVHNNVGLGNTNGMTGYDVGDGITVDKWSGGHAGGIPLTAGYQSVQGDFGSESETIYAVATSVILTARGGLFDATGNVTVTVKYRIDGP